MSATQFVIENILSVLGGAGLVAVGLATFLGKLISDRALQGQKSDIERKFQQAENDHATSIKILEKDIQIEMVRRDQFHQISKSTFENIFNRKIEVYSSLLRLKTDYDKFQYESGTFDIIDPTSDFLSHFNLFRKSIEENRLYISNELSQKYDDWYMEAAQYFRKMEEEEYAVMSSSGEIDHEEVWMAQVPIIHDLVSNTGKKMALVLTQIEHDVREIRERVSVFKGI